MNSWVAVLAVKTCSWQQWLWKMSGLHQKMTEYLIFPRKTLQTAFGEKWINRSGLDWQILL